MRTAPTRRLAAPSTLAVLAFSVGCTPSSSSSSSSSSSTGGMPDAAGHSDASVPRDAAMATDGALPSDAAMGDADIPDASLEDAGPCGPSCGQLMDADGNYVFYPDDGGPYCLC